MIETKEQEIYLVMYIEKNGRSYIEGAYTDQKEADKEAEMDKTGCTYVEKVMLNIVEE